MAFENLPPGAFLSNVPPLVPAHSRLRQYRVPTPLPGILSAELPPDDTISEEALAGLLRAQAPNLAAPPFQARDVAPVQAEPDLPQTWGTGVNAPSPIPFRKPGAIPPPPTYDPYLDAPPPPGSPLAAGIASRAFQPGDRSYVPQTDRDMPGYVEGEVLPPEPEPAMRWSGTPPSEQELAAERHAFLDRGRAIQAAGEMPWQQEAEARGVRDAILANAYSGNRPDLARGLAERAAYEGLLNARRLEQQRIEGGDFEEQQRRRVAAAGTSADIERRYGPELNAAEARRAYTTGLVPFRLFTSPEATGSRAMQRRENVELTPEFKEFQEFMSGLRQRENAARSVYGGLGLAGTLGVPGAGAAAGGGGVSQDEINQLAADWGVSPEAVRQSLREQGLIP